MVNERVPGVPHGPTDEWDIPLGGIPGMTRLLLERTHVEAAAAEVRFVSDNTELPQEHAAAAWEALGIDRFPVFEPSTQTMMTLTMTPQGPVQTQQSQRGWQLSTSDRMTSVMLLPTMVVIQTRNYTRYSTSLSQPLTEVLESFTAVTGASRIQRLGLRYINRLSEAEASTPTFWRDHIRHPFAGPLTAGVIADLVTGMHQQVQLRLSDVAGANIQCGVFEEPRPGGPARVPNYNFLVDLDVFREQATDYDQTTTANQVRQLNRTALALFATVLSDQYLAELNPIPAPPARARATTTETVGGSR